MTQSVFEKPSHGFYYEIGAFDAEQGRVPQVLEDDLVIYQDAYDSGYQQGLWYKLLFSMETM